MYVSWAAKFAVHPVATSLLRRSEIADARDRQVLRLHRSGRGSLRHAGGRFIGLPSRDRRRA